MNVSIATIQSENGASYMRKLGQHWSHKFPVKFEESRTCTIELPTALCEMRAEPDHLQVELKLQNAEDQERMEKVVQEHIQRFAVREPLEFAWLRSIA